MQTIFSIRPSLRGIVLLSSASLGALLLLGGCSTKHQKSALVQGYYPTHQTGRGFLDTIPTSGRQAGSMPPMVQGSEAMHRATLRPYTVFNKRYYPKIVPLGTVEQGIASWYGPDFHGKKTSNGEIYDMYAPGTAAHKTLPMNTIVRVTHAQSGDQVIVRINDRGPFVDGRIIDLSFNAGKALGLDVSGIAPVKLEVLRYDDHVMAQNPGGRAPSNVRLASTQNQSSAPASTPRLSAPQTSNVIAPMALSRVERSSSEGYAIQIGAFRSMDGASVMQQNSQERFGNRSVRVEASESSSGTIHRVLLEGFDSREAADRFMRDEGLSQAVVVNL